MKISERDLEILLTHHEKIGGLSYHDVLPLLGKETRIVQDKGCTFEITEIHEEWFGMRVVGSEPAKVYFEPNAPGIRPFLPIEA